MAKDINKEKDNINMSGVFCNEAVQTFYYNSEEEVRKRFWKDLLGVAE